jgi:hypothetical protein
MVNPQVVLSNNFIIKLIFKRKAKIIRDKQNGHELFITT